MNPSRLYDLLFYIYNLGLLNLLYSTTNTTVWLCELSEPADNSCMYQDAFGVYWQSSSLQAPKNTNQQKSMTDNATFKTGHVHYLMNWFCYQLYCGILDFSRTATPLAISQIQSLAAANCRCLQLGFARSSSTVFAQLFQAKRSVLAVVHSHQ